MKNALFNNKRSRLLIIVSACVLLLIAVLLIAFFCKDRTELPSFQDSQSEIKDTAVFESEEGITITSIGNYTGMFFEDGSDELVTNTLMIVMKNSSGKDLQLARLSILYNEYTAEFEATNIPAGESVVLLEKNRREYKDDNFTAVTLNNVVFFESPMTLMEEAVIVRGGEGYIEVENISHKDISGTTYIYYKNKVSDMFYGGITYRTRIDNSIKAGETVKVPTQHYREDNTSVVQVMNLD